LGIGDWGLGIGDWGLGIGPNNQSPIPNPHINIKNYIFKKIIVKKLNNFSNLLYLLIIDKYFEQNKEKKIIK